MQATAEIEDSSFRHWNGQENPTLRPTRKALGCCGYRQRCITVLEDSLHDWKPFGARGVWKEAWVCKYIRMDPACAVAAFVELISG